MAKSLFDSVITRFGIIQVGINIAIIIIQSMHLVNKHGASCLLSDVWTSAMYCNISYGVSAGGIGIYLLILILQIKSTVTTDVTRGVLITFLAVVYGITATVLTWKSQLANNIELPEEQWRTAIWALYWSDVLVTLIMSGVNNYYSHNNQMESESNIPL